MSNFSFISVGKKSFSEHPDQGWAQGERLLLIVTGVVGLFILRVSHPLVEIPQTRHGNEETLGATGVVLGAQLKLLVLWVCNADLKNLSIPPSFFPQFIPLPFRVFTEECPWCCLLLISGASSLPGICLRSPSSFWTSFDAVGHKRLGYFRCNKNKQTVIVVWTQTMPSLQLLVTFLFQNRLLRRWDKNRQSL